MNRSRIVALLAGIALVLPTLSRAEDEAISREAEDFFEKRIRPVLARNCYGCHSAKSGKARGGLLLDSRDASRRGGDSGPAVVPKNLDESLLWAAVNYDGLEMPPSGKLSPSEIADFERWIEMGAPDPRLTKTRKLNSKITEEDIATAKQDFWAYKTPQKPSVPKVADANWAKTDIDRFVLARLEDADMRPAEDADPHTVLRRLTFDLVGLSPSAKQIETFTRRWETNPDSAVERIVDELLASEQFGERWGRHWLDVARYAESTGKEINLTFPYAWRYRDYVIDSFNADKPYDRFLMEQIAGDLLPVRNDEQWSEHLVATSFLAIGPKTLSEQNPRQFTADLIDEQIDATTRVFLGTSVACARCHDHKFDAIPQTDYYALAGIFQNTITYYGTINSARNRRPSEVLLLPTFDERAVAKSIPPEEVKRLREQLKEAEAEENYIRGIRRRVIFRGETGPNLPKEGDRILSIGYIAQLGRRVTELKAKLATVDENGKPVGKTMGVQETSFTPRDATVYIRGELEQPAGTVRRGVPKVLTDRPLSIRRNSSGRLELAKWMADEQHPLTSRVMANRVWKHLLGKGLVRTTENFGTTGQMPTHPELLDHLATRFVDSGWSVKSLIREIATSRIYRSGSEFKTAFFERDPENELLWRTTPRRLEAEALRDAMLFAAGELEFERPMSSLIGKAGDATVNGGSVTPRDQTGLEQLGGNAQAGGRGGRPGGGFGRGGFGGGGPGGMMGRGGPGGRGGGISLDVPNANHRSVYMPVARDFAPRSLEVFDFPDSSMIIGSRDESNTSNQALYMLNNPLVLRASRSLAERLTKETRSELQRIQGAFESVYGRPATSEEISATKYYMRGAGGTSLDALARVCQALFASAEFRYRY